MHKKGYSLEQIMDVTDMSEDEIKAIIGYEHKQNR